jgi:hypothetical protein
MHGSRARATRCAGTRWSRAAREGSERGRQAHGSRAARARAAAQTIARGVQVDYGPKRSGPWMCEQAVEEKVKAQGSKRKEKGP